MDAAILRPERTDWPPRDAYDWCLRLARWHYENFPVASFLLPRPLRPHVAAVYAFARIADDLADEPGLDTGSRLKELERWESSLNASGESPGSHPVFVALRATAKEFGLPRGLFTDLLSAFRQDVTKQRYASFDEVLDYCSRSANPVGRIVLRLFGHEDGDMDRLSDALCTALQLTNFWQDVSQDLSRGRVYIPMEDCDRFAVPRDLSRGGVSENNFRDLMAFQVQRTRQYFASGKPLLKMVNPRFSLQLRATWHGGSRVLEKIERTGYNVLQVRPKLVGIDAAVIGFRALLQI